jgi:uncharacterized protein (TIGR03000 family)
MGWIMSRSYQLWFAAVFASLLGCACCWAQPQRTIQGTPYSPSPGLQGLTQTSPYYTYTYTPPLNGYTTQYYASYARSGLPTYMTSINYPWIYGEHGYYYAPGRFVYSLMPGPYTTAPTIYYENSQPTLTATRYPTESVLRSLGNRAELEIRLPADAELRLQGVKMNERGSLRRITTPTLDPGMDYTYDVNARWMENGMQVSKDRHVMVRAGDKWTVDFTTEPEENVSTLRARPRP